MVGRFLAGAWMILGILTAAFITSTITESISGTGYLDIYQQEVWIHLIDYWRQNDSYIKWLKMDIKQEK